MEGTEEGVISVRPMSRVRLEQQHPVQGGVKDVHHYHDAFCVNNGAGVYGASAAGCAYVHTLSSGYSSTESVGYSPGYGVGVASYGARRGRGGEGVAMKREEDEITVVSRGGDGGGGGGGTGRRKIGRWCEERVVKQEEVGARGCRI